MLTVPAIDSKFTQTTKLGWKQNPNYKITLYDNNPDIDITNRQVQAYIPENFHFRVVNNWEPFLTSLDNTIIGKTIDDANSVARPLGLSLNYKLLSALVWHRMEPVEFSFTFLFDSGNGLNSTIDSALENVTKPVMRLIAMATPSRGTGTGGSLILNAPGPTISDPSKNITMKIGRFFYIDSVVFESLDITWHTMAESSGDFIAADVEVGLKGWYAPDKEDILNYFGQGISSDPTASAITNYIKSNPQDFSKIGGSPVIYSPGTAQQAFVDATNNVGSAAQNLFNPSFSSVPQQFTGGQ